MLNDRQSIIIYQKAGCFRLRGKPVSTSPQCNKIIMDPKLAEIIKLSREALQKAYCPYSNFPVGAALLCDDDTIFTGCNVENASYGLSNCAERTAIFKAVSEGFRKFKAIAVATNIKNGFAAPCGACRQVLVEFGENWDVYLTKPDGSFEKMTIAQLLPHAFTPQSLKKVRSDVSSRCVDILHKEI